ncbi:Nucleoporin nup85, variant 4 [Entomophthora muscae]|uniref:Nucleoporin nup85, variant 4 n=1 Tax=Entomophthora muscae TaxID=34485 RepID=A0ACC2S026_9FUNG|nr:Nucleoporin nup85, variant 4 [Entomophthora muscae]
MDESSSELLPSDCLLSEFFVKTNNTFIAFNQLFQAREAMLLFAINFPSGDCSFKKIENSISLKDIEAASSAYLAEANALTAILQKARLSSSDNKELFRLERLRAALQLYHVTFGMACPEFFTESYLNWLNSNYTTPGRKEANVILMSPNPFEEPIFGAYLMKCAVRGILPATRAMLSYFPPSPLMLAVQNLFETMPRYTALSKANFSQLWSNWKTSCQKAAREHLNRTVVTKNTALLHDLIRIMSGQCKAGESIFDLLCYYCDSWQEMLGALLLFHFPTMVPHRVGSLVECILNSRFYKDWFSDKYSDRFQACLLTSQLYGALKYAHSIDAWLGVHLSDLIQKREIVEKFHLFPACESASVFREKAIVDYVTSNGFMNSSNSFYIGASYLSECPTSGKDLLCKLLPNVSFKDLPARDRALALCQDLFLFEPLDKICKAAALYHIETHEFPIAVKYLSKMSNIPYFLLFQLTISALDAFFSNKYDLQGLQVSIQCFGVTSLNFLTRYIDFQSQYQRKRLDKATEKLKDFILDRETPRFMIVILLLDALPFLEEYTECFDLKTISDMIKIHEKLDTGVFPFSSYKACLNAHQATSTSHIRGQDASRGAYVTGAPSEEFYRKIISEALQRAYYKFNLSAN